MSGGDIDSYVGPGSTTYATVNTYWEAWEVDSSGAVIGNEDSFGVCGIVPRGGKKLRTTRGRIVMIGEAAFYPSIKATALAGLGFSSRSGHPANGLPSTDSPPALSSHTGYAAPTYTVTCTWDSDQPRLENCYSNVV
jgi:hypothetical protein